MQRYAWLLVFLLAAAVAACGQATPEPQGRTYYDRLNLDSPTSAVETFVNAFQREDFMTVYLVFDYWAQHEIYRNIIALGMEYLIDMDALQNTDLFRLDAEHSTHIEDGWFLFDQLMLAGSQQNGLLIDLRGETTIGETQDAPDDAGPQLDGETVETVDVLTTVEGIEGDVIFRTTQSPVNDDWRVHQVIVSGGNVERIPWSVPDE